MMEKKETRRDFLRWVGNLGMAGVGLLGFAGLSRLAEAMAVSKKAPQPMAVACTSPYLCGEAKWTCNGNLSGYTCACEEFQFECGVFNCQGAPGDFICDPDFNCRSEFNCVEEIWGKQFHLTTECTS